MSWRDTPTTPDLQPRKRARLGNDAAEERLHGRALDNKARQALLEQTGQEYAAEVSELTVMQRGCGYLFSGIPGCSEPLDISEAAEAICLKPPQCLQLRFASDPSRYFQESQVGVVHGTGVLAKQDLPAGLSFHVSGPVFSQLRAKLRPRGLLLYHALITPPGASENCLVIEPDAPFRYINSIIGLEQQQNAMLWARSEFDVVLTLLLHVPAGSEVLVYYQFSD